MGKYRVLGIQTCSGYRAAHGPGQCLGWLAELLFHDQTERVMLVEDVDTPAFNLYKSPSGGSRLFRVSSMFGGWYRLEGPYEENADVTIQAS
jgi:hypothetical protein